MAQRADDLIGARPEHGEREAGALREVGAFQVAPGWRRATCRRPAASRSTPSGTRSNSGTSSCRGGSRSSGTKGSALTAREATSDRSSFVGCVRAAGAGCGAGLTSGAPVGRAKQRSLSRARPPTPTTDERGTSGREGEDRDLHRAVGPGACRQLPRPRPPQGGWCTPEGRPGVDGGPASARRRRTKR